MREIPMFRGVCHRAAHPKSAVAHLGPLECRSRLPTRWLNAGYWLFGGRTRAKMGRKKEPPLPAALSYNREASNRVDRSHSMSRRWTIRVMGQKA